MRKSSGHPRGRTWALAFLAWTLVGLAYAFAMLGNARLRSNPMTWSVALSWSLGESYLWMLLSPLPLALARWAGFEGRHWRRALSVHLPAALLIALLHHVLFLAAYWRWGSPIMIRGTPLAAALRASLAWRVHDALVVYGLLVLTAYVIHHLRQGEAERVVRSELEAQLATSQLQALRMQLQPHFLFNTLNGISALVIQDPTQAKAMISKLGDFLRLTLEDPEEPEAPLQRELRVLTGYLEIQRLRFSDRLRVSVEAAEDTLHLSVPFLMLQPLVENALQHGVASRAGPAALAVRSRREGDVLVMEVEDDGVGLPARVTEGVGLTNTRARLRARYGDAARLDLQRRAGGGVLASVRVPVGARP